jgi:ubiquinone/menaquinone biosynthesis C-methylase UbiE
VAVAGNEVAGNNVADNELERTRKFWDRFAADYDRRMERTERLLFPGGRQWACGQAAGKVLEVAVGTGRNLPYYGPGVTLTGIDLSPGMLAVARDRARDLGLDADLRTGNAEDLEFGDAEFDTVLCTISLCNIPDYRAAIAEMYRVLRPGGHLVLLDHVASDRWWLLFLQRILEQVTRRTNGDYQTRRPLPLVAAAGFVVSHSERSKFGWVERLVAVKPKV